MFNGLKLSTFIFFDLTMEQLHALGALSLSHGFISCLVATYFTEHLNHLLRWTIDFSKIVDLFF